MLARLDLKSAYHIIPVHPDDRHLLGMEWNGEVYVDAALPFGLHSAPKAMADGLMWIMKHRGIRAAIDAYLFLGDPSSDECATALSLVLLLCECLGVPVSAHKLKGPSAVLVFLGISLDTLNLEIRWSDDKLLRLKTLIRSWQYRKSCTKRELLSLTGPLHHACKIITSGRSFLRRMISLSTTAKELHHHIRLNTGCCLVLQWWSMLLNDWNGQQMLACMSRTNIFVTIISDASGNWSCGAWCGPLWQMA